MDDHNKSNNDCNYQILSHSLMLILLFYLWPYEPGHWLASIFLLVPALCNLLARLTVYCVSSEVKQCSDTLPETSAVPTAGC